MEKIREDLVFKDDLCRVYYVRHGENGLSRLFRTVILVGSKNGSVKQPLPITEKSNIMSVNTWGYKNANGPATWALAYPDAAGHGQSPVNISTSDTIYDSDLTENGGLKITYNQEEGFDAENNGLSFKVDIKKSSELRGGPLKDKYRLEQFHLHWGSHDDQGSEHTIDGQSYAAELHLVHYNCTKYSSFKEAVNKNDGLAVLGIMIQAGPENKGFKVLSETARSIKQKQKCHVATTFNPECLLPKNTSDFWTYHGSLTTPPCYESVQWIVFKEPVQYSPQQLTSLRNLMDAEVNGQCIVDNFRPPLPLGDRKVRCSFQ